MQPVPILSAIACLAGAYDAGGDVSGVDVDGMLMAIPLRNPPLFRILNAFSALMVKPNKKSLKSCSNPVVIHNHQSHVTAVTGICEGGAINISHAAAHLQRCQ